MRPTSPDRMTLAAAAALVIVLVATAVTVGVRRQAARRATEEWGAEWVRTMETAHGAAGVATTGLDAVQSGFHQSVETLRAEVGQNPDNVDLVLRLARLLHDGHRAAEAVEYYRTAIRLDPSGAEAYHDLAAAYGELGRWAEASDILLERLQLAPDDPVTMYDLGATFANRGDVLAARVWWTAVISLPADPDLRQRSERALAQLGGLDPP